MDSTPPTKGAPGIDVVEAGAKEAARAVARLTRSVGFAVDRVELVAPAALAERNGPRALVVSVEVTGGVRGRFALVTSETHARGLARSLLPNLRVEDTLSARHLGALTELGNIGASAWLNGVATVVRAMCLPSVPNLVLDEAGAAITSALGAGSEISVARLDLGTSTVDLAFRAE
jgi:chemotaxis protein CheC